MRRLSIVALATLAIVVAAGPAWAHEEITPATVSTGKPTFLTLSAANEGTSDLTKLTLAAPQTLPFGATTQEPAGWAVNRTDAVITWSGGTVKPDRFAEWGFEIEGAEQPGNVTYHVTLGFADGRSDQVDVPLAVVAGSNGASGAAASSAGVTARSGSGSSGRSRANWALAVASLSLLTSVVALLLTAVNRRGPGAALAVDGSPVPPPGDAQNW